MRVALISGIVAIFLAAIPASAVAESRTGSAQFLADQAGADLASVSSTYDMSSGASVFQARFWNPIPTDGSAVELRWLLFRSTGSANACSGVEESVSVDSFVGGTLGTSGVHWSSPGSNLLLDGATVVVSSDRREATVTVPALAMFAGRDFRCTGAVAAFGGTTDRKSPIVFDGFQSSTTLPPVEVATPPPVGDPSGNPATKPPAQVPGPLAAGSVVLLSPPLWATFDSAPTLAWLADGPESAQSVVIERAGKPIWSGVGRQVAPGTWQATIPLRLEPGTYRWKVAGVMSSGFTIALPFTLAISSRPGRTTLKVDSEVHEMARLSISETKTRKKVIDAELGTVTYEWNCKYPGSHVVLLTSSASDPTVEPVKGTFRTEGCARRFHQDNGGKYQVGDSARLALTDKWKRRFRARVCVAGPGIRRSVCASKRATSWGEAVVRPKLRLRRGTYRASWTAEGQTVRSSRFHVYPPCSRCHGTTEKPAQPTPTPSPPATSLRPGQRCDPAKESYYNARGFTCDHVIDSYDNGAAIGHYELRKL